MYASPMSGEKTRNVISHCLDAWAACGKPANLKTDNGPAYTSTSFQVFCETMQVSHTTALPYNPQGQDIVERAISDFDFTIPKEHTKMLLTKEYLRVYNRYKNRYDSHILKSKIITFLVQKGYEYDDVIEIINELWEESNDKN